MPKTQNYNPEFKKEILRLRMEEGRTIKSLNEEFNLGDGTIRNWMQAFQEECETNPDAQNLNRLYEENRRLRQELAQARKENTFLKKAAAFFNDKTD